MVTLPFFTSAFLVQATYFGGEIRRGARSGVLAIATAMTVAAVALLFLTVAALGGIGESVLASVGLADLSAIGHPSPLTYVELAAIASGNGIAAVLISLGMVAYFLMIIPSLMLILSRIVFAWAFDGLIGESIAQVDEKRNAPTRAVVLIGVLGLGALGLLTANPDWTALVGILGLTLTFLVVSIAAIMFPYRLPEVFESSPTNSRLAGVPTMTVLGVLGSVGIGAAIVIYLLDPNSGTSWSQNPDRVLLAFGLFVAGAGLFYILRAYRRARGVNVDLAFREIPPE
jgi:amino acid transporter